MRFFSYACVALSLLLVDASPTFAQSPTSSGVGETGTIRGRLVDSLSRRPITSGSITIRRAADSSFAGGSLPRPDGSFSVDGLTPGVYTMRIRAIGFGQRLQSGIVLDANTRVVDLGPVMLAAVVARLEGQEVIAERDETIVAPDRTSYSTKNMTAASGGTAVDVLRNIPLVEVDGSNKVSLRNNENVVVQINGRSSPLKGEQLGAFLAQLPARTVKNVEVATNPSAKNDPEGTAGIINIVLNQDTQMGLSGGLTAGTATTGQLNSSGNVGMQSGPLILFLSGSLYRDERASSGTISRTNLLVPNPAFVQTRSLGTQHPFSTGGTVRSEYRFTKSSALSFDGFLSDGRFHGDMAAHYVDLDGTRAVIGQFDQFNDLLSRSFSQDYALAFRRQGKPTEMQLASEVEFSNNDITNDTDLSGTLLQPDSPTATATQAEREQVLSRFPTWSLKTDYTQPFGANTKLEAGFKGMRRHTTNDLTASVFDATSAVYVPEPSRGTAFDYREDIGAGYAVISQQLSRMQTQAGLRLEAADSRLALSTVSQQYVNRYASAFPSAIVSYKLTDMRQARISYSRRISRPGPRQLSPVEYRLDARNLSRGNPNLRPEYTDAIELGLQDTRSWGSVQLTPYVRHTSHAVRNIQFVDSTGVSVGTYDNVASTLTIGSDFNVNVRRGPLTLGGGGSAYRYSSDASNLSEDFSTKAAVWSLRGNGTWKFSPRFDMQLFASYRAPYATEGGSRLASVFMNAGARYKLWGEQGNVSISATDPFNLLKFGYRTANGSVIEINEQHFGARAVYVTFTRTFGQALKLRPKQPDADGSAQPPT
jgi:ferric enterobactin receptor